MKAFFKTFAAAFLALVVFSLLCFLFMVLFIGGLAKKGRPHIPSQSVLVLNLSQHFNEQYQENFFSLVQEDGDDEIPGLYDVVRLLHKAKDDKKIAGVYILANSNDNGFAASQEIRNALLDFKKSGKFVLAHGKTMSQRAYSVANMADKIYLMPTGRLDWSGYNVELAFLKGTLEKLDIEPQVFYAGKFKSATEPFRSDRMTPENKLQTTVWINDLYNDLLMKTAEARKVDTGTLHQLANVNSIQTAGDALANKLIDGLKYDDEFRDEIRKSLGYKNGETIDFVTMGTYMAAGGFIQSGGQKIALIYAEGEIVDGKGFEGMIGSETYRALIRKARTDKSIKAIVFRVNSGGGSALASDEIWRELSLAKKEKPVVVSFGDVAASGGYYISCAADSIFCLPSTITGSIGVFGIVPNMQGFFKNKLGITFDGVGTAPYADAGAPYRPMKEEEKRMIQASIDTIYDQFKQRVAAGRKKDISYIDSIAQGRIWTGLQAIRIGLVDKFGGLQDAVESAARMAKIENFKVIEYPEPINILEKLLNRSNPLIQEQLRKEMGEENYKIYMELKQIKNMTNKVQARLPFRFFIH